MDSSLFSPRSKIKKRRLHHSPLMMVWLQSFEMANFWLVYFLHSASSGYQSGPFPVFHTIIPQQFGLCFPVSTQLLLLAPDCDFFSPPRDSLFSALFIWIEIQHAFYSGFDCLKMGDVKLVCKLLVLGLFRT